MLFASSSMSLIFLSIPRSSVNSGQGDILFADGIETDFASKFGISLPTEPVSSCSVYGNIAPVQVNSVIPHACVNGTSSFNREWNLACVCLSSGAAPQAAHLTLFRKFLFWVNGDMMMAITIGGTTVISVTLNFSMFIRNCSRSNRRIIYVIIPILSALKWVDGTAAAWKTGIAMIRETCGPDNTSI